MHTSHCTLNMQHAILYSLAVPLPLSYSGKCGFIHLCLHCCCITMKVSLPCIWIDLYVYILVFVFNVHRALWKTNKVYIYITFETRFNVGFPDLMFVFIFLMFFFFCCCSVLNMKPIKYEFVRHWRIFYILWNTNIRHLNSYCTLYILRTVKPL